MLTKDDLKSLRKVIREEVEAEGKNVKNEITYDISSLKIRIFAEFDDIKDRMKNSEVATYKLEKVTSKIDKRTEKIYNTLEETISFFDKQVLNLSKKVKVLEEHPYLKLKQI